MNDLDNGSFTQHVRDRLLAHGDRFYTFVKEGADGLIEDRVSYRELDSAARSLAAWLSSAAPVGKPVLLLFPAGLDFLRTFLGCLYAGVAAVPAPVPTDPRSYRRVANIVADTGLDLVLTTSSLLGELREKLPDLSETRLDVRAVDHDCTGVADDWRMPALGRDSVAFLQYTAGGPDEVDPQPGAPAPGRPSRGSDPSDTALPLTDLQQAYFVGEQGVDGHAAPALYIHEYAFPARSAPDPDRLAGALRLLRRTHPALRLRLAPDGTQSVAPPTDGDGNNPLTFLDFSAYPPEQAVEETSRLRRTLISDLPGHDAGQPFLVRLIALPGGTAHLQIVLRLTAFDGVTIQLFFSELVRCYTDPFYHPPTETVDFRDFVLDRKRRTGSPGHRASTEYWETRLETLPPAVELPRRPDLGAPPAGRDVPLHRAGHRLDRDAWKMFQRHASENGLSPGSALFGLYVEALQRWSGGRPGTVTVLASQRAAAPPGTERMWGCAATTVLVGYPATEGSFAQRCQSLQERLYTDLESAEVSGVEVGRALNQRRGTVGNPVPVVFSSGLDLVPGVVDGFRLALPGAILVQSAISTPEVLLDHQVYEQAGHLVCNFDHDRHAYPPGLIDDLADYHRQRLRELATDARQWRHDGATALPGRQLADRRRANDTRVAGLAGELHQDALEQARRRPDAIAVADGTEALSYRELDRLSGALAVRLRAAGVGRDPARPEPVAVRLPRSWRQAVAVLGILRAGGAYLPVAPGWPASRVAQVLRQSGAVAVVGAPEAVGEEAPELPVFALTDPTDLDPGTGGNTPRPDGLGGELARMAYVIYTSGSTGMPKGVVIAHGAATNTLRDLAGRLELTHADRVLAVSSLAFDLSVFDIFGILGTGGTVVVPPENEVPDPQSWGELCRRHGITIWNSVPALLQVTLEYLGDRAGEMLGSLRLIMLSGDWVPLPLLDRIAEACPDAKVVAMGGATEASIWSNYFWAAEQPAGWSSVPYGYPLANQTMHVLDQRLADAPVWVPGDLYIGGAGVADGYLNAPELTHASFLTDPATGERRYRTGDRARYWPGGILEFLGREDDQVKVGGHRIELGEIEVRLAARPEVGTAVAVVAEPRGEASLAAFVTPAPGGRPDPAVLRAHLAAELPPYMVPGRIVVVETVPLSANGKVDRKALLDRLPSGAVPQAVGSVTAVAPRTPVETRLLALWRELLGPVVTGVTDDFFALGGNSLLAVRLFHQIRNAFGRTLPLASLMRGRTVAAQAAQLMRVDDLRQSGSPLVRIRDGAGSTHLVLVHPVGGDVLCYQELVQALEPYPVAAGATVHGLRALGLLPDEQPAAGMTELVAGYAEALCRAVPDGPLHLVGWSMGGTIAVSLAERLARQGRAVASVTAIDSFTGDPGAADVSARQRLIGFFSDLTYGAEVSGHVPDEPPGGDRLAWLRGVQDALVAAGLLAIPFADEDLDRLFTVYVTNSLVLENHRARAVPDRLLVLRAARTDRQAFPGLVPLDETLPEPVEPRWLDADHFSVMGPAGTAALTPFIVDQLWPGGDPEPLTEEPYYLRSKLWC